MSQAPVIAVLLGGTSSEREVSLGSGRACALALARSFPTCQFDVTSDAAPAALDRTRHVVFSALHGGFGEHALGVEPGAQPHALLDVADALVAVAHEPGQLQPEAVGADVDSRPGLAGGKGACAHGE